MDPFITVFLAQLLVIGAALMYNVIIWAQGGDNFITTYARNNAAIGYAILIHQQMMTVMLALHFYW